MKSKKDLTVSVKGFNKLVRHIRPKIESFFLEQADYETPGNRNDIELALINFVNENIVLLEKKAKREIQRIEHNINNEYGATGLAYSKPVDVEYQQQATRNQIEFFRRKLIKEELNYENLVSRNSALKTNSAIIDFWDNIAHDDRIDGRPPIFTKPNDPAYRHGIENSLIISIFSAYKRTVSQRSDFESGFKFNYGLETCESIINYCIKEIIRLETSLPGGSKFFPLSKVVLKNKDLMPWKKPIELLEKLADELYAENYRFILDKSLFIRAMTSQTEIGEKCPWHEKSVVLPSLRFLFYQLDKREIIQKSALVKWICANFYNGNENTPIDYPNFQRIGDNIGEREEYLYEHSTMSTISKKVFDADN